VHRTLKFIAAFAGPTKSRPEAVRTGDGSVSVFEVGIGCSVFLRYFSSRFGILYQYFKIQRYRYMYEVSSKVSKSYKS